jgi:hypothetical protein
MEKSYWELVDGFWYFYANIFVSRYKIDFDNKLVVEQYNMMGDWEDANPISFNIFPPNIDELKSAVESMWKNKVIQEKEWMADAWNQIFEMERKREEERDSWKKKLKGLINVKRLWEEMEDNDSWDIEGIVEIELTDEKRNGYQNYQCARIKGEKGYLYMLGSDNKCFVWQRVGMMGDDYSGWLLHPLKDGTYLKTSYSC